MTRFLLIRHALTDAIGVSIAGRARGVALNNEGRKQAEALAHRVASLKPVALYTSPLERTRETIAPLAKQLGLIPHLRAAFIEVDFGDWTGKTFAELREIDAWHRFNRARSRSRPPGGETMLEVQARAVAGIELLLERHPQGTIGVMSHGDVIRALVLYYTGAPVDLYQRIDVAPASVTVLDLDAESARVIRMNDTGEARG
jgi:probable phosphomutase (TIGR03848 family)